MIEIRDPWWCKEFSAFEQGDIDYISRDKRTAVEVKQSSHGSRGLYAATMRLAIFLTHHSHVRRGCLVLNRTRLSLERLREEWYQCKAVFQESVSCRLAIVVVEDRESWIEPDDPYIRRIAQVFESAARDRRNGGELCVQVGPRRGQMFYEILKVLICRWLQRQGPIPLGKLAEDVGCSYPTVRKSLERVSLRKFLGFTSSRSVELKAFPHAAWNELLALSPTMRNSLRFRDRTGDKPAPEGLLKRLKKIRQPLLATSGVLAARFWHSDFDLHGTPRLDLVYHAAGGEVDLSFVRRLDPALALDEDMSASPALVVHPVARAASLFVENVNGNLPWADPVETALDLCDMSLTVQANQLLTHLRPETRLE
jgi:hypothetical protein